MSRTLLVVVAFAALAIVGLACWTGKSPDVQEYAAAASPCVQNCEQQCQSRQPVLESKCVAMCTESCGGA